MAATCIFCKIIKGEIPSMKLFESDKTLAFLDIQPLSRGHSVRLVPPLPTAPALLTSRYGDLKELVERE
ncbi:hypothetical protein BLS_002617 [Venturia inaequalis]|uniref:HIT domain-containing protein n=1 Tax=Venturia inaequalis TaxID=5025 RepID=A0A8H3VQ71_VENIN|nr:hypothetical protein BLS_002617 [Venturia inaequalis]KAE9990919.1 hypothetical protein EG327_000751 [Venturia inaequalis]